MWGNQTFSRMSLCQKATNLSGETALDEVPRVLDKGLVDMGLRYGSRAFKGFSGVE